MAIQSNTAKIVQLQAARKEGKIVNYSQAEHCLKFVYDYDGKRRIPAYKHIPADAKAFYLIDLKSFINPTRGKWHLWAGTKALSASSGYSEAKVKQHLKTLEKHGLITILVFLYDSIKKRNVIVVNELDEARINAQVIDYHYKGRMPKDISPETITKLSPDLVKEILRDLKESTKKTHKYKGLKKSLQKKDQPRGERGRFIKKTTDNNPPPSDQANDQESTYNDGEKSTVDCENHGEKSTVEKYRYKQNYIEAASPPGQPNPYTPIAGTAYAIGSGYLWRIDREHPTRWENIAEIYPGSYPPEVNDAIARFLEASGSRPGQADQTCGTAV